MEKTITIRCKMQDPAGRFIPSGVTEDLKVEITDQAATFKFNDAKVTQKFVYFEAEACKKKKIPCNTLYIPRFQKAVTKYPNFKKEEIKELILEQLNKLGAKKIH